MTTDIDALVALDIPQLALLRDLVAGDIARDGECSSSMVRAGLLAQILATLTALSDEIAVLKEREGWQPIETAPRDGSDVLLYFPLDGLSKIHAKTIIGFWRGGWIWQGRAVRGYSEVYQPTHWRPLPDPPALTDKARSK